jgi:hypothetical protein
MRLTCLLILLSVTAWADDAYEQAPIHYTATAPDDAATRLERLQEQGKAAIQRGSHWTVLHSLLQHFKIAEASQVMVFSKTSKQNDRIGPATPRVIYFNDESYVGYSVGGQMEIATIDATLGPIFYLADPDTAEDQPIRFVRDQSCLSCHGGPFSPDVPGLLVRSVFPDERGHPIMSQGSRVVDTTTPFEQRWGGWYVTGRHGSLVHQGNVTAQENGESVVLDLKPGQNITDLSTFFDTDAYPRKTSDIVALMVLEHQTSTQNNLTKANHAALRAMHMQQSLQKELGEPVLAEPTGTARRIIDHSAEDVLDALLFKDEAPLPEGGIEGSADFPIAFAKNAPETLDGRALKDFQLLTRLFKYRCSYLIHGLTFQHLTPPLKQTVLAKLWQALQGNDPTQRYAYLGDSERQHISRILIETLPNLPAEWQEERQLR